MDSLKLEAPIWMKSTLFGVLASAIVYLVTSMTIMFIDIFLPTDSLKENYWLAPLPLAVLYFVWYVPRLTARLRILKLYVEILAADRDELIEATRARVWGTLGPAWRTTGLSPLFSMLLLLLPAPLLFAARTTSTLVDIVPFEGQDASRAGSALLIFMALLLFVLIGWIVWRTTSKSETVKLLVHAAHDPERRKDLVRQAVEITPGEYERSTVSWIGAAFFFTWAGNMLYGKVSNALGLTQARM